MTSRPSILQLLTAAVVGFAPLLLEAQEEKKPACRLRFLAVGNAPPFKQEIRNGIRYELPPPPGSVPPRRVVVERESADEEVEELGGVTLKLGSVSKQVELPAVGDRPIRLRDMDEETPWLEFPFPGEGRFLVVLRRAPKAGTWDEVQARVIDDRLSAGGLRLINATDQNLAIVYGEQRIALRGGQAWTSRLAPGKPVGFQVGLPDGAGGLERVLNRSLEQGPAERTLVVLSAADRPDARTPLKMTVLREDVRKRLLPEPEPK